MKEYQAQGAMARRRLRQCAGQAAGGLAEAGHPGVLRRVRPLRPQARPPPRHRAKHGPFERQPGEPEPCQSQDASPSRPIAERRKAPDDAQAGRTAEPPIAATKPAKPDRQEPTTQVGRRAKRREPPAEDYESRTAPHDTKPHAGRMKKTAPDRSATFRRTGRVGGRPGRGRASGWTSSWPSTSPTTAAGISAASSPPAASTIDGRGSKPAYRLHAGQRRRASSCRKFPASRPGRKTSPWTSSTRTTSWWSINKPPGMVVHPARGHWSGTLAGALQFHFGPASAAAAAPPGPGIVHRLDRDTSGVILVARTDQAHHKLAAQFQNRTIEKEYFAIVAGAAGSAIATSSTGRSACIRSIARRWRSAATIRPAARRRVLRGAGAVRRLRRRSRCCPRRAARTRSAST